MRPFRGNCQQVSIMEAQLRASGMAMKVDFVHEPPLYSIQKEFVPNIIIEKYMVRTDSGKKFIPEMYFCKFVYNMMQDKAEVHMDRQVVDLLLRLVPERSKELEEAKEENNREDNK